MFFPEALFVLSPRDYQVTWLDPTISEVTSSVAAAAFTLNALTVPDSRSLLLQSASLRFSAGGAQTVVEANIQIQSPGGGTDIFLTGYPVDRNAAVAFGYANWSGSVMVPPGWTIFAFGSFSAGVAANSLILAVIGLLIPVGNIQRV